jgi:2-polyprenyl-6-hydroxyphenyl methylase/3-demethylubiquinone-9 3-methyltransferase
MDSVSTPRIDNDVFDRLSDGWWSEDTFAALLKNVANPWRIPYFQRTLSEELSIEPKTKRALDVGCGGGIIAEEFARTGLDVTGIDPSGSSIEAARKHAASGGLKIDYRMACGDDIPFGNETFDVVFCCDVLDHIFNWDKVIAEIARVLKRSGVFFFDTINRTTFSKIVFIKLAQEWKFTRFFPPNLHAWEMFITPEELKGSLARHGFKRMEVKGTKPVNPIQMFKTMRQYKKGKISPTEFGKRTGAQEGTNIDGLYMGYAVKL